MDDDVWEVNYTDGPKRHGFQWVWWLYGWLAVRPKRRLFGYMMRASSGPRWWFERYDWIEGTRLHWPNIHWYVLYRTVFRFCRWLEWDGSWIVARHEKRLFGGRYFIGRVLRRIGKTTAGYHCSGFECYHCGSEDGCQCTLSEDESGSEFILHDTWACPTQDGTDYRFVGTTICPRCGFRNIYEDGSL